MLSSGNRRHCGPNEPHNKEAAREMQQLCLEEIPVCHLPHTVLFQVRDNPRTQSFRLKARLWSPANIAIRP